MGRETEPSNPFPLFFLMQPDAFWFTMEWLHSERERFACVSNNVFSSERVNICPAQFDWLHFKNPYFCFKKIGGGKEHIH